MEKLNFIMTTVWPRINMKDRVKDGTVTKILQLNSLINDPPKLVNSILSLNFSSVFYTRDPNIVAKSASESGSVFSN